MNRVRTIGSAALLITATSAAAQPEYECIEVTSFTPNHGLAECYLYDINDQGVACGTATITNGSSTGYTGFVWDNGVKTPIPLSWPRGLSNPGLVAGVMEVFDLATWQGTPMPMLPGKYPPLALLGVNDAGVAVGYVQTCNCSNSQGFLQVPYVWDAVNGARTLAVPASNGARKINNAGQVLGWIGGNGNTDGFVYDLASNQYTLVSTLFSGPNVKTTAMDINDLGVVTGWRLNYNGAEATGYTWSPSQGVKLLPMPGPGYQPYVTPRGINNAGVVVGSIYTPLATEHAFVYDAAHGVRDLNSLAILPPGMVLTNAQAINDQGWIVGFAYGGGGGFYKSYVLKPLAGECYADCEGDGDLDIFDFLCFQGEHADQTAYADCENDGDWDVFDFLCFQGAFAGGCS